MYYKIQIGDTIGESYESLQKAAAGVLVSVRAKRTEVAGQFQALQKLDTQLEAIERQALQMSVLP